MKNKEQKNQCEICGDTGKIKKCPRCNIKVCEACMQNVNYNSGPVLHCIDCADDLRQ